MDIFGILDPDPHENFCGSETLHQNVQNHVPLVLEVHVFRIRNGSALWETSRTRIQEIKIGRRKTGSRWPERAKVRNSFKI